MAIKPSQGFALTLDSPIIIKGDANLETHNNLTTDS